MRIQRNCECFRCSGTYQIPHAILEECAIASMFDQSSVGCNNGDTDYRAASAFLTQEQLGPCMGAIFLRKLAKTSRRPRSVSSEGPAPCFPCLDRLLVTHIGTIPCSAPVGPLDRHATLKFRSVTYDRNFCAPTKGVSLPADWRFEFEFRRIDPDISPPEMSLSEQVVFHDKTRQRRGHQAQRAN